MKNISILLIFSSSILYAHDIEHNIVTQSKSVLITLTEDDNSKFSFESYEIYFEDEKIPFQVGKTDGLGRIVFIPDRTGEWHIKCFSEDGHGTNVNVKIDENMSLVEEGRSFFERYGKASFGAGIILCVFGILMLFVRRKNN